MTRLLVALAAALLSSGLLAQETCELLAPGGTCSTIAEQGGGLCTIGSEACPERYVFSLAGSCLCNSVQGAGLVGDGPGPVTTCSIQTMTSIVVEGCDQACTVPASTPYSLTSYPDIGPNSGDIIDQQNARGFTFNVFCNSYTFNSVLMNLVSIDPLDTTAQGFLYELLPDNTVVQENPLGIFDVITPVPVDNSVGDFTFTSSSGPVTLPFGRYVFAMACLLESCTFVWNGPGTQVVASNNTDIKFGTYVEFSFGVVAPVTDKDFYFTVVGASTA